MYHRAASVCTCCLIFYLDSGFSGAVSPNLCSMSRGNRNDIYTGILQIHPAVKDHFRSRVWPFCSPLCWAFNPILASTAITINYCFVYYWDPGIPQFQTIRPSEGRFRDFLGSCSAKPRPPKHRSRGSHTCAQVYGSRSSSSDLCSK